MYKHPGAKRASSICLISCETISPIAASMKSTASRHSSGSVIHLAPSPASPQRPEPTTMMDEDPLAHDGAVGGAVGV